MQSIRDISGGLVHARSVAPICAAAATWPGKVWTHCREMGLVAASAGRTKRLENSRLRRLPPMLQRTAHKGIVQEAIPRLASGSIHGVAPE